jgi:hypothetical protein
MEKAESKGIEVAGAVREEMVGVDVVVVGGKQQAVQLAAVHSLRSWEDARRRPAQAVREYWRCVQGGDGRVDVARLWASC